MAEPGKKRRFLRAFIVLAASGGLAGLIMFFRPTPERAEQPPPVLLVKTVRAEVTSPELFVEGFGTVRAKDNLSLVSQVSGRIVRAGDSFREGEGFEKGEELLKIDPSDYRLAVENAGARLLELEAELSRLEQQEENLLSDLDIAEKDAKLALSELERHRYLIERKVIAERLVESVEQKYLASKARLQSVKNSLKLLGPQKAALKARLKAARAALDTARLNLERTSVKAPWDGWVLEKLVETGQYVSVGAPLGVVYRASLLEVEVGLGLKEVQSLKAAGGPGRPARVVLASEGEAREWTGRLARLKAEMDETTRTWPVVVELPMPGDGDGGEPGLVPGMFVKVRVSTGRLEGGVVLPAEALRGESSVFVVEGGRLRKKPVTLVRASREEVTVLGLDEGELVIVSPVGETREGAKVRLVSESGKVPEK